MKLIYDIKSSDKSTVIFQPRVCRSTYHGYLDRYKVKNQRKLDMLTAFCPYGVIDPELGLGCPLNQVLRFFQRAQHISKIVPYLSLKYEVFWASLHIVVGLHQTARPLSRDQTRSVNPFIASTSLPSNINAPICSMSIDIHGNSYLEGCFFRP